MAVAESTTWPETRKRLLADNLLIEGEVPILIPAPGSLILRGEYGGLEKPEPWIMVDGLSDADAIAFAARLRQAADTLERFATESMAASVTDAVAAQGVPA